MNKNNWIIILILFVSIFSFLGITGTLTSGYHFIDDHEIISINNDLESVPLTEVASAWIKNDLTVRFRPMYYLHKIIEIKIFGTNFLLFSLYVGLLAFMTFSLFYLGLRNLKFSIIESLLFLMLAFAGHQMAVWWRTGTAETIGLAFLSFSFYFMTKCLTTKHYALNSLFFCFFLVLSSLCKESFVIIIPAFVFYKIWNEKIYFKLSLKESVKKNYLLIVPIVVMFAGLLIIIFYAGTTKMGYAGVDYNLMGTINGIISVIKSLKDFIVMTVLVVGVSLYFAFKKHHLAKFAASLLLPFFFCFLIAFPNIVLYAKSGMTERYLLPLTIGVAYFVVSIIKGIDSTYKWKRILLFIMVIVFSLGPINSSFKDSCAFASEGRDTNLLLSSISQHSNDNTKLLLVVDPVYNYELSLSLRVYLSQQNITNLYVHAIESSYTGYTDSFSQYLSTEWHKLFKGKMMNDLNGRPDMIIFLDKNISKDFKKNNYKNIISNSQRFAIYEP